MDSLRIELGISPLSSLEVEQVLTAMRTVWQPPSWIKRQSCGSAWLLMLRHETAPKPGENPNWFAEKLVAAIWLAIGRYACITLDIETSQKDEPCLLMFSEEDYQRILRDFRFSHSNIRS
ncbi:hypothetical protein SAMN05660284_01703 [Formivibrio citricus]|uniref:Uncharacterized protein n=1 Tax=Formivibrio citricus TaxID=83765 RepID=A0A1I4ZT45_9NEIS|nr:hypothetical protein [Formivibrio citricus]SFN53337.1 hypothetical protein SAMN05660284_01703 [Formivibrio citricus]